ncbi:hypothetical protein ACM7G9_09110 [Pseudomonas aeruginosa]
MELTAYLQHGKAGGPYRTERVPVMEQPAEMVPAVRSRTGYGKDLPTPYLIDWEGRRRRVYAVCFSNVASFYIRTNRDTDNGGRIFVTIDREGA